MDWYFNLCFEDMSVDTETLRDLSKGAKQLEADERWDLISFSTLALASLTTNAPKQESGL